MARRNLMGLLLVLVTGGLLVAAFEAAGEQPASTDNEVFKQYDRFIEVMRLVQKQYVRDVDTQKLFDDAIQGMLSGLDPFSNYIGPEEIDDFTKATRGKFGGIGIQIGMRKGWLTVISPLEDTPAYREGVLAGDLIVEIDGKSTEGMTLNDAVKILTGDPGTKVKIKVRHLTGELADITITRAIIEVRTVKGFRRIGEDSHWEWMIDPDKKVGYIRCTGFVDNTVEEMRAALDEMLKEGMKSLVLDLRFNPGGQLKSAVEMVDMFIDDGIIVQTKGRTTPYWKATATEEGTLPYFPMVVLVNPFSASASEIVSGALKDHGRAIIVGERTFGKGSVQNVIPLEGENAALKLTTSKYYTASGRNIHRDEDMTDEDEWGVMPDIIVPMKPEQYVEIARARADADIIKANGDGEGEAKPENPAAEDVPEGLTPGDGAEQPEAKDELKSGLSYDPQLQRAVDVLRSVEVLERYAAKKAA